MKYQFLAKNCQKGLAAAILLLEIVRRLASGEVSKATFEVVVVASSVIVKDYSMPAIEQASAVWLGAQGRRRIILRGGNRGVVAISPGL
jgi:hypothetical protein